MVKIVGLFAAMAVLFLAFGQGLMAYYASPKPTQPAPPVAAQLAAPGPQAAALSADETGHFKADVRINGQFLKALLDTGATVIAIPADEARKIGINPAASAYTSPVQTANGIVHGARVKLNEVRISSIVVRDVEALIVPKGLPVTLVGMNFFTRLQSFEIRGKSLVMRQ